VSWQVGLILVLVAAIFVPWLFAEIAAQFGTRDEWDEVADRKRQIERNARRQSGEFQ
jgi:hypothetical protein